MSVVYRAHDTSVDCTVAIKEMKDPFSEEDERRRAVEEFHKEAKILANLHHEGLPRVSHFFEHEHSYYVVMDFIEGETLDYAAARHHNRVPEPLCLDWATQICGVLDYLHRRHPPIIFRDLKPANIMLTPEGHIKLIDFGIAKIFEGESKTHTLIRGAGTPGFAPPEQYGQFGRSHTDVRTDVYGLGATLYTLSQGRIPVEATTRFMHDEPLEPVTGLRSETAALIMRCLELNPDDRYQSIHDVIEALHPLVATVSMSAPPTQGLPTRRPRSVDVLPQAPPTQVPEPDTAAAAPVRAEAPSIEQPPPAVVPHDLHELWHAPKTSPPPPFLSGWRRWGIVTLIVGTGVVLGSWLVERPGGPKPSPSPIAVTTTTPPPPASPTPAPPSPAVSVSPQTPTSTPTAVATDAVVHLSSEPLGAHVTLDGDQAVYVVGSGGFDLHLAPGTHKLRVTQDGYLPVVRFVTVAAGESTPLDVHLHPASTLRVLSTPVAMKVKVNGQVRGQTPLRIGGLTAGRYTVTLSRTGYRTYTQQVSVNEGEVVVLDTTAAVLATPTPEPTLVPPPPVPPPPLPWHPHHAPKRPQQTPEGPKATPW